MKQTTLAALSVLLLAGCAGGGSSSSLPSLGTQFSGSMKIGHQQVPLPPGQWFVRGSSEAYTAIGSSGAALPPTNFIVLVNQAPENPHFIFVRNIADYQFGWQASRRCSPKNSFHSETRTNLDGGDQDCWWVKRANIRRSVRNFSSNKKSHYYESAKQVSEWARSAGVTFPVRSFVVGYHMANYSDIFGVEYFFDPKQDQGPTSGTGSYTDRLAEWGAGWHSNIVSGFNGKLGRDHLGKSNAKKVEAVSGKNSRFLECIDKADKCSPSMYPLNENKIQRGFKIQKTEQNGDNYSNLDDDEIVEIFSFQNLNKIKIRTAGVIAKSGVLTPESSGNQIEFCYLNTVFELYSSYHLGQIIEAA